MSSRARMQRRDRGYAYTWARDDDRQNQLKMLKPRQETDLYVSLEMGIGRPTANTEAFRVDSSKFKLNGFDVRRKPAAFGLLSRRRAASFARIRYVYVPSRLGPSGSCQGALIAAAPEALPGTMSGMSVASGRTTKTGATGDGEETS